MKCQICNNKTTVITTMSKPSQMIRRRQCENCKIRFNTCERPIGKAARVIPKIKDVVIRSEDDWIERVPRSDYADRIFGKIGS